MSNKVWEEKIIEKKVTYSLEVGDRFILIENVPARVNEETGEKLFAPKTVEQLQQTVWGGKDPVRTIETSVYGYVEKH